MGIRMMKNTLDDRIRRKKVLFCVIVAGIILGTSLILAELTARLMPRPHKDIVRSSSEFQYDPILGLKGIPGYSGQVGFTRAHISINAHGFRDDDWEAKLERAHQHHAQKVLLHRGLHPLRLPDRERRSPDRTTCYPVRAQRTNR